MNTIGFLLTCFAATVHGGLDQRIPNARVRPTCVLNPLRLFATLLLRINAGATFNSAGPPAGAPGVTSSCPEMNGSIKKKVAVIQDQQIPKEFAVKTLEDAGFDVEWSLSEPSDAWAICTVTAPVSAEVLDKHPHCKLVAVSFTGFNHVDLSACKERGIAVVNVPAYSTDAVAELALGLTLAVYREIPGGERTLRKGGWVHSAGGMEIRDKVVGIVGLGNIGLRTAELFSAFRPKEILGWSRSEKPDFIGKQVSLEEVFERSDIVTIHIALNAETQGFISRDLLEKLQPDSVLVNVARGGVMDQNALAELLTAGRFRAGLDVFETEPLPADDPIMSVPEDRVVLAPHVAYKSVEALRRRMAITAANLKAYSDGVPQNVVLEA